MVAYSRYMAEALKLARQASDTGEVPVGAVVVQNDVIVGTWFNQKEGQQDPTWHAELMAIRMAADRLGAWRLSQCTLVSTLEPCPMCAGAILQARIGTLVYGAKDFKWGADGTCVSLFRTDVFNHRVTVHYFPTPECEQVLTAFFSKLRKNQKKSI